MEVQRFHLIQGPTQPMCIGCAMRITHDRRGAPPAPGATLLATTPGSGLYFATFEYLQQPGMYGKPFGFEGGGRGGGSGPPTPQSKGCPDRHPTSFASSKKSEIFLSVLCAKKCSKKSKKMSILDLCSKEKSRDSTFPAFFRTEIFSAPYHFEVEEVGVRPPPHVLVDPILPCPQRYNAGKTLRGDLACACASQLLPGALVIPGDMLKVNLQTGT